jgi:hypothetical protein
MRGAYKTAVAKQNVGHFLGDPHISERITATYFLQKRDASTNGQMQQFCEYGDEITGFIRKKFLGQLNGYGLWNKSCKTAFSYDSTHILTCSSYLQFRKKNNFRKINSNSEYET